MQGKTVVITGATSGIGEITAIDLAKRGARVVFVARDKKRADATLATLDGAGHSYHLADLSTLAEMKRVGAEIAAKHDKIDVLINNAGAMFDKRRMTDDGLELTFALNHMAYFVLTALLRDNVEAAAPGARIISTASQMHRSGKVNFDDLQMKRGYTAWGAYSNSKLMNVLFTHALAKRLEDSGVAAYCLHPGFVATRFGHESGGATQLAIRASQVAAIPVEEGAKTLIWLASEPTIAGKSGGYFNRCAEEAPSVVARDDIVAERLWAESSRVAGL